MNTLSAFIMVFDWDKAARLINDKHPQYVEAGLRGAWECTGGTIYENGEPVMDSYTYLASTWAVPEIHLNGEYIDCYKMQSETPGWDGDTKWAQSALDILAGGESNG